MRASTREGLVSNELFHRVLRARERLHDAYDEPLTIPVLARAACLSPFHFLRVYTAAFGDTPGRELSRVRIARARDLLEQGVSVTETCFAVGFSSLGSFSTRFARDVGMTPREFQQAARAVAVVPGRLLSVYVPFCFAEHFAPEVAAKIAIVEKSGHSEGATPRFAHSDGQGARRDASPAAVRRGG
jgi:AraC-like DNA-binding protein